MYLNDIRKRRQTGPLTYGSREDGMKYAIFLVLALAVSGCTTQGSTGGEATASQAGQRSGTIRFPDGTVYTGQLKNGEPHGRGSAKMPDGSRYTGQGRNGRSHDADGTFTAYFELMPQASPSARAAWSRTVRGRQSAAVFVVAFQATPGAALCFCDLFR